MQTYSVKMIDDRDIQQVYRMRYLVYVRQQGFQPTEANHAAQVWVDALDSCSVTFGVVRAADLIGSLRLTHLQDVNDPTSLIDNLSMGPAVRAFGIHAVGMCSRFMFDKSRSVPVKAMVSLMKAGLDFELKQGIRLSFGNCSQEMLPFYTRLGFRTIYAPYQDKVFGTKYPIVFTVGGHKLLSRTRTLISHDAISCSEDIEVYDWFTATY